MKLSLAWIFDHLNADYKKFDIQNIVKLFNEKVAEIEGYKRIKIDLDLLTLAQVKEATDQYILLYSPELKDSFELPVRSEVNVGEWYLARKVDNRFDWADSCDLGAEKEIDLPALFCSENELDGGWKKNFKDEDYILDVDNKSITNRPDLWGHRGFAREFALILGLELKPESEFLEKIEIEKAALKLSNKSLTVEIKDNQKCKKLAGLFIETIENKESFLWMAVRLSKIDSRVINAIVDTTNYTMLDIGQPMHAFDANKIKNKIIARSAKKGEKLVLLDGDEVELIDSDCVIADDRSIISLSGIMGGQHSGISNNTKRVVLESGIFDPVTVRLTSARLKKRSDASARFEKSLDLNQNVIALERFVKIFKDNSLVIEFERPILSVGTEPGIKTIQVSHELIEKRLGVRVNSDLIVQQLNKIGFVVRESDGDYIIDVPSNRASKDISIPEDIIEEIARIYGYSNIPYVIPKKETVPHNIDDVLRIRNIKNYMSFACKMMEVKTYPFYDESFVQKLDLKFEKPIHVLNPVSQNWTTLVNSLIPNMLKVMEVNLHKVDSMRFYELGRIWNLLDKDNAQEERVLSGIIFERKNKIDFYDVKNYIQDLFLMFSIKIEWKRASVGGYKSGVKLWYDKNLTAELFYSDLGGNKRRIGTVGFIDKKFLNKLTDEGSAFVFELDADFLIKFKSNEFKFKPLFKFPEVDLDISILVPLSITIDEVENAILESNMLIKHVSLVDSFQRPEWVDKKSLTFRFKIVDENKTLHKDEIEGVLKQVERAVENFGAEIR
jgi:phenylalanyl-tRNA synthetase beta chain